MVGGDVQRRTRVGLGEFLNSLEFGGMKLTCMDKFDLESMSKVDL
jgi:hypothetical protein